MELLSEDRKKPERGPFAALGRWIVRHPWYPVVFWVVLLVIAVPFLPLLGSVTTNSATSTPSNSPSAQANAELARLFPGSQGGSSSTLLFYGPNLTDGNAQRVILNVSAAVAGDGSLADVAGVASVYSEYSSFLAGQAELAERFLAEGVTNGTGLPASFLGLIETTFPHGFPNPAAPYVWANATVEASTLSTEPLPVPYSIYSQFVAAGGTATILQVYFSVADDYTNPGGGQPVYSDLPKIDSLVSSTVHASDPTRSITYVQTGPAPLDLLTQTSTNASLALVLPITVGLLLAISMLYFRSPVTPLLTFAGLGIALVLGLGATVFVGSLVWHVDSSALALEEVFVLGIGTDYAIFLVARYREELVRGKASDAAIVTAVTWAGKSVATSGAVAILAMVALTFSGVALIAQWGSVLSLAVFITLALSLTLVPAFLKILGPRILWPNTRQRFERHATVLAGRIAREETYFYRAGRATQRRPWTFVALLMCISVPLVVIAVTAPVAYDFYGQLPSGQPATDGLVQLGNHFGDGFAVPSFALVTFAQPLVTGNSTNAVEFTDIATLTAQAEATSGIASVQSPVGPDGTTLANWLNLSTLPLATRTNLLASLSHFIGTDGRTVLIDLEPSATGLSLASVTAVESVKSSFGSYAADHPEIVATAYGGGAPTINDLASQTFNATVFLIIAVTLGLLVVLLVVLRSWVIALMGVSTIALSIAWAWAVSYLVFQQILGFPLFFYVRTILFILVLGLGIDYTIFLLTRVSEERARGRTSSEAAVEGVAMTGGIITAAAIILASAFAALTVGSFILIRAIGFSVAVAVILDAMVVRTYMVPAFLQTWGDRAWTWFGQRPRSTARSPPSDPSGVPGTSTPPTDPADR
ncbi:MAG: MMPL family transporter [Thermoplasmata archaeon]|jgi:putative drug exporter of the RND superfamily